MVCAWFASNQFWRRLERFPSRVDPMPCSRRKIIRMDALRCVGKILPCELFAPASTKIILGFTIVFPCYVFSRPLPGFLSVTVVLSPPRSSSCECPSFDPHPTSAPTAWLAFEISPLASCSSVRPLSFLTNPCWLHHLGQRIVQYQPKQVSLRYQMFSSFIIFIE